MTTKKAIAVRLERLPHRHAVERVRSAYRQLRKMPMTTNELSIELKRTTKQIVQE
jgi:hypothetical protein